MRRVMQVLLILSLLTGLTGCWDDRPIDMRSLVLVMGVAPAPHGQLKVLLQIPTPSALTSLVGGAGGAASSSAPSSFVLTGIGPSVGAAISAAQGQSDRDIYLGQVQMVFFSTHLSAQQFALVVEFLSRLGPFDKTAFAAVAQGSLYRLLSYHPASSRLSALYFTTLFSCSKCQRIDMKRSVFSVEKRYVSPTDSIWLPVVYRGPTNYIVDTIAVYEKNRVAVILSPQQSVALSYAMAKTTKATVALSEPFGLADVRALNATPTVSTTLKGHQLYLSVKLGVTGVIDTLPAAQASPSHLDRIEAGVNRQIAHQVLQTLVLLQSKGADPVGFGRRLLWLHPQLVSKWPTLYRHAHISVSVRAHITNIGDVT